jgi:hypothetical protein
MAFGTRATRGPPQNGAFVRRPDKLVHLDLKPNGQRVGDDTFNEVFSFDRRVLFWERLKS